MTLTLAPILTPEIKGGRHSALCAPQSSRSSDTGAAIHSSHTAHKTRSASNLRTLGSRSSALLRCSSAYVFLLVLLLLSVYKPPTIGPAWGLTFSWPGSFSCARPRVYYSTSSWVGAGSICRMICIGRGMPRISARRGRTGDTRYVPPRCVSRGVVSSVVGKTWRVRWDCVDVDVSVLQCGWYRPLTRFPYANSNVAW